AARPYRADLTQIDGRSASSRRISTLRRSDRSAPIGAIGTLPGTNCPGALRTAAGDPISTDDIAGQVIKPGRAAHDPSAGLALTRIGCYISAATHPGGRARKFHQHAVTSGLDDAAMMLGDLRINELAAQCFEAFERA